MAILSATVLSNCYYIPQFIASGTKMLFENGSAPTSWTKDITYNNRGLRVVNSTVSVGGSKEFLFVYSSSKLVTGTVSSVLSGAGAASLSPSPAGLQVGIGTFGPITTSASLAPTTVHDHAYTNNSPTARISSPTLTLLANNVTGTSSEGQSVQHSHAVQATPHTHPLTSPSHIHTVSESPHTHTISPSTQNFAVYYRDVILATKD